jgi:AcrR family transcriptional regulator
MTNLTDSERDPQAEAQFGLVDTLWSDEESARRGPKRAMSRAAVVEAAIAIADESGIGAVSMAAVAKRLGFTSMSLYRYISSKDDLVALMVDTAHGSPPESVREASSWQETCRAWSHGIRGRYLAHPWTLDVPISGPPMAPNQLLWLEHFLQGMSNSGLAQHELLSSALLISAYVLANARLERDISARREGGNEQEREVFRLVVDHLNQRGTYPNVVSAFTQDMFDDDPPDFEFDFGLERIVDGLQALISRHRDIR